MQRQFLKFTLYLNLCACIQGNLFAYTAYFSDVTDGTVTVVDTTDNSILDTIEGLTQARDLAITPDGRYLYVSQLNDTISVIDTSVNSVVHTIPIGSPRQIAVSPDGESLYVTSFTVTNVNIYSTSTNTYQSYIDIGSGTRIIAINAAGDLAYIVTNSYRIFVVNLQDNSTIATITGLGTIVDLIFSTDGTKVYIASDTTERIYVYDALTHTQLDFITTGENPKGLSTTPDGEFLYVCNSDNSVNVISTSLNEVVATISVGTNSFSTAITPDGNTVYTANSNNSSVINASTNTVSSSFALTAGLYDVLISPLATPASLSGSQKINDFGVRYELYNTLNWTQSITPATIGYNIYRNGTLIGSTTGINATTYVDHNREEGVSYEYSVRSRTSNGDLSYPATVTVN